MQDGRRRLVGVVDDDAAVRDSLRFLLEAAGFSVVTFASAEQFLAATDPDGVDCLLLDHHMPQVTGLEMLRRLRRAGWGLPVALMTGSPSTQLMRRALELGAVVVLEKPLTDQALFQFVGAATG
jgi:two-component system, LuxR family, response regulator FixJ